MKNNLGISTAVAIIATLGLTSQAWAACNLNTVNSGMNAVSVQSNQGQGGFSCASVILSSGEPAVDLLSAGKIFAEPTGNNGSRTLDWNIQNAAEGTTYPVVLVRVVNNGEGASCNYTYDGITTVDSGLGNISAGPVKTGAGSGTFFCGSLDPVQLPVEEEAAVLPVTNAESVGCIGTINDGSGPITFEGGVVMAESLDGQTVAMCNSETEIFQAYCEDSCVGFRDVGESAACLESAKDLKTGEYGLAECKPCLTALDLKNDTTGTLPPPPVHPINPEENMEFCWEKTGSVYEGLGDLGDTPPDLVDEYGNPVMRTPNTMLKHTAIRQSDNTITWYNKCYKTKTVVNGRTYTVTTCK